MPGFNWDNYETESAPLGEFDWNAHPVDAPQISETESGLRGLAQGASLGFADELTGGAEALWNKAKGNPEEFGRLYAQARDESRNAYKAAETANPKTYGAGELGGMIGTAFIPGLNAGTGARLAATVGKGALQGGLAAAGNTENDVLSQGGATDIAKGVGLGALGGAAGYGIGKSTTAGFNGLGKLLAGQGDNLNQVAENLAVKATGATGKQAEKFSEGTGRELLDRGIVKFGDTPERIAERAAEAQTASGKNIGAALDELDSRGVNVSVDNIAQTLKEKISALEGRPAMNDLKLKLQKELENISELGNEIPISRGELSKRDYQGKVKWNADDFANTANSETSSAFKKEVERAASDADPEIAGRFLDDKKLFGTLAPVREAAEKRASQLNQSPYGGFGDLAAGGMAANAGGPAAAAAVASRRFLAPRAASSLAVGADKIGDVLKQAPQMFGKFAPVLQNAAQRGSQGLAATHFILQQTQPEYQKMMQDMQGTGD